MARVCEWVVGDRFVVYDALLLFGEAVERCLEAAVGEAKLDVLFATVLAGVLRLPCDFAFVKTRGDACVTRPFDSVTWGASSKPSKLRLFMLLRTVVWLVVVYGLVEVEAEEVVPRARVCCGSAYLPDLLGLVRSALRAGSFSGNHWLGSALRLRGLTACFSVLGPAGPSNVEPREGLGIRLQLSPPWDSRDGSPYPRSDSGAVVVHAEAVSA